MPVILNHDLLDRAATIEPSLKNARIGYKRISGTAVASTSSPGYPAASANNSLTYSYWRPVSLPATWSLTNIVAQKADYIGIASHTLGGRTVTAEAFVNGEWDTLGTVEATNNAPIMFLFPETASTEFRISITGVGNPIIGVVFIGMALAMQRGIYQGHSPLSLSRKTTVRPNMSENGQWLGRTIIRGGSATTYEWKNLSGDWYLNNFDPFVESARSEPFFIAWRPIDKPFDCGYVWTSNDISPTNSGPRDLMSVSISVEGLSIE